QQFQGRYILRHPFTGEATCAEGKRYRRALTQRLDQEAKTLANLTGWNIGEIRRKAKLTLSEPEPWWQDALPSP
ncbi:MAG: DUF2330 domain-containing protein, partial [Leptolyngbyaceae bacterium]|nr:DUF2330 domain-containing protein [Leptolyngbyaceae bacterium]